MQTVCSSTIKNAYRHSPKIRQSTATKPYATMVGPNTTCATAADRRRVLPSDCEVTLLPNAQLCGVPTKRLLQALNCRRRMSNVPARSRPWVQSRVRAARLGQENTGD